MALIRTICPALVAAIAAATVLYGAPVDSRAVSNQQLPERQLPVFRADSHFVRVDTYPTHKDGTVIRDLTADDFELTEDGVRQTIASVDFFEHERWSPGSERPDPRDQRESFRLAADPSYKVIVVYVNRISWNNSHYIRQPLIELLTREIGPKDLYGLLLPQQEASDLILGRFTPAMQSQLSQFLQITDHNSPFDMDAGEQQLYKCFGPGGGELIRRWRADNLYRDLEGIISILGTIREERKSIILVTEDMPGTGMQRSLGGTPPAIGGSRGSPPTSNRPLPGAGGLTAGTYTPDFNSAGACQMFAASIPQLYPERFEELIARARRMNVAVNPINPTGLMPRINWTNSYLRELASATGGLAVVNTNGIREGLDRIANDMSAYYVLGYNTTNTKWDGRMRKLRVRLKATGETVRSRFEYQAPSEEDIAAMRAAAEAPARPAGPTPEESAMSALARIRPDAVLHVQGTVRGHTMTVSVEVPSGTSNAALWRAGGVVDIVATDPQGRTLTGATELPAGSRGAAVQLLVPPDSAGPWQVTARLSQPDADLEDYARIEPATETFFGDPQLYRAAPQPAAPYRPAADQQFWRTERFRAEWFTPHPDGPAYTMRARLLQPSGTPLAYAPPVSGKSTGDGVRVRLDLTFTSFAPGDYLLEVTADRGDELHRTLVAVRIMR